MRTNLYLTSPSFLFRFLCIWVFTVTNTALYFLYFYLSLSFSPCVCEWTFDVALVSLKTFSLCRLKNFLKARRKLKPLRSLPHWSLWRRCPFIPNIISKKNSASIHINGAKSLLRNPSLGRIFILQKEKKEAFTSWDLCMSSLLVILQSTECMFLFIYFSWMNNK